MDNRNTKTMDFAQFLQIPRTTLRDKMAKYGMVGKTSKREVE